MFSPTKESDVVVGRTGRKLWDWIPGIWLLLLISVSLAPWIVKRRLGVTGIRHNRGHLIAFFITAVVFTLSAPTPRSVISRGLGAAVLAVLLEGLEVEVFGNPFEWGDVRMDLIGLSCGLLVACFAYLTTRSVHGV